MKWSFFSILFPQEMRPTSLLYGELSFAPGFAISYLFTTLFLPLLGFRPLRHFRPSPCFFSKKVVFEAHPLFPEYLSDDSFPGFRSFRNQRPKWLGPIKADGFVQFGEGDPLTPTFPSPLGLLLGSVLPDSFRFHSFSNGFFPCRSYFICLRYS